MNTRRQHPKHKLKQMKLFRHLIIYGRNELVI